MLSLPRRVLSALIAVTVACSALAVPALAAEQAPAVAEHRWWDDDDDDDGGGNGGSGGNGSDQQWGPGRRGPWTDLIGFTANNGRGAGYWVLTRDGDIYGFNGAPTIDRKATRRTIVGIAAHPSRVGFWLVDRQGLVTAHGAARNYGRAHLKAAVGIAPHRSGRGYWVAGKSGSVRALGAAGRYGG